MLFVCIIWNNFSAPFSKILTDYEVWDSVRRCPYSHPKSPLAISTQIPYTWTSGQISISAESHRGVAKQGHWWSRNCGWWAQQIWLQHCGNLLFFLLLTLSTFSCMATIHNFLWLDLHIFREQNVSMALAGCRHADCICGHAFGCPGFQKYEKGGCYKNVKWKGFLTRSLHSYNLSSTLIFQDIFLYYLFH